MQSVSHKKRTPDTYVYPNGMDSRNWPDRFCMRILCQLQYLAVTSLHGLSDDYPITEETTMLHLRRFSTRVTTVGLFAIFVSALVICLGPPNISQDLLASPGGAVVQTGTVTVTAYFPGGGSITVPNIPAAPGNCKTNVRLAMLNANYLNSKFTSQTSYYYPYGDYVTEINGYYGSGTSYWSLYINGTPAKCGINTQTLNAGDNVAWYLISSKDAEKHDPESFQARVHEIRKEKHVP